MSKRQQLLEEFKLGIWTKAQYIQQISTFDGGVLDKGQPSTKRQKTREYSPDWDIQTNFSDGSQDSDDA